MTGKVIGDLRRINVSAGVNHQRQPFVRVTVDGYLDGRKVALHGQFSSAQIRSQALVWLAAADAAESDALVFQEFEETGADTSLIAAFLGGIRARRNDVELIDMSIVRDEEG